MKKLGNTSSAVMNQRIDPKDSLDDYPTPPWAMRALLKHVAAPIVFRHTGQALSNLSAWEPACNRGYLARALQESFADMFCTDIHDYGWTGHQRTMDFLGRGSLLDDDPPAQADGCVDMIFTNPPFVKGVEFIERCFEIGPRVGFGMFVRNGFLDGIDRYDRIYSKRPPTILVHYAERVPMVKGRYDPEASTATTYCWLVWLRDMAPLPPIWIPKCRLELYRASDADLQTREGFACLTT